MNYYNEIKNKFIEYGCYKIIKDYSKNKNELETYYEVGKLLIEAQGGESRAKYGNGLIKEYSKRLTLELGKGYTISSLKRYRQFYLAIQKGASLRHQLTWTHYKELLVLDNKDEINYYIYITLEQNLSYRQLHDRIKSKEYERLDEDTKLKLISNEKITIKDEIKHPIIIKNRYDMNNITEKM